MAKEIILNTGDIMKITPKKVEIYRPGWEKPLCRMNVLFKDTGSYKLRKDRPYHYISWDQNGVKTFEQSFYTTNGYVNTLRKQLQIEAKVEYFKNLEPLAFMREMIKNG